MSRNLTRFGTALTVGLIWARPVLAQIDWPAIQFTEVFGGLSSPTAITYAGDGSGRLFIAERAGRVRVVVSNELVSTPFLDISDRVSSDGEGGLLSLAFPPAFASNGWFYVCYTATGYVWTLSRVLPPRPGGNAVPLEVPVLTVPPPPRIGSVHISGQIAFGPDGFLYASRGDAAARTNAQILSNLWGKILRIDVESDQQPYGIPADNPFADQPPYRPEIWAFGLRNPWRFSFDRLTGDLYVADVGRVGWEEVSFQPAATPGGRNFGWPWREGAHEFEPPPSYDLTRLTDPIAEYQRCPTTAASVIGGYAYRGPSSERMDGVYFYSDFVDGRVWGLKKEETNWVNTELANPGLGISTFGEDEAGHLYAAGLESGKIYRLDDSGLTARPHFGLACPSHHGLTVEVYATSPGSVLHYTTNGIDPTETDPVVVSGATLAGTNGSLLKVRAFSTNRPPSEIRSTLLTAPEIVAVELSSDGRALRFRWFGVTNHIYLVQSSQNLSDWTTAAPFQGYQYGSNSTLSFTQPVETSGGSQRFYRVAQW